MTLVHFAAHHLGLAPQLTSKRQPPFAQNEPYRVQVKLDLRQESEELLTPTIPLPEEAVVAWDGSLIFESWGDRKGPDDPVPAAPSGAGGGSGQDYFYWIRVHASGVPDEHAPALAQYVVQRLREIPEVLHLYIDSERVFPPAEVRDEEVLAMARQDLGAPAWVRQQAAILTQNLYLEWMRAMLGQQQRLQTAYFQQAQEAARADEPIRPPEDFLAHYREALQRVLPHLRFARLDQERRRLIYSTGGAELPYEDLSGGERELAFLIGQVERFGIRRGLFLLDEPELHLNAELLRGWLEYLRGAVETGQVWIATHALEAAEVAGLDATLVLERGDDPTVKQIGPLGDRPALATLAGQLGSPAFSLARSRFLLIEGDRPGRERERFARVLDTPPSDRFLESGGHREVLTRLRALQEVASEAEQLRVGAFLDRDFRTDEEAEALGADDDVCVLPVHEVENFFLSPEVLGALAEQGGGSQDDALGKLRQVADDHAGRWAWERTVQQQGWEGQFGAAQGHARTLAWADLHDDPVAASQQVVQLIPDLDGNTMVRMRAAVVRSANEYRRLRETPDELWKRCFGKEVLRDIAPLLGFASAEALEDRVAQLWRTGVVERPPEVAGLREYLESIPVLS